MNMEINLLLTAKPLRLAPQLTLGGEAGGVLALKNISERTYLQVTSRQWRVLQFFRETQTVPRLLETLLDQRLCPALGELYELVLKAVRARILVEPEHIPASMPAVNWGFTLRPAKLRHALGALLALGLGLTLALHPELPPSWFDAALSLALLGITLVAGSALAAALVRGAGGEVYLGRYWQPDTSDLILLTPREQRVVLAAPIALLAAVTGFLAWHRPEWSLFPFIGLLVSLRPIFRGRISRMIWCGASPRLSDAAHDFVFPLNRTPRERWRLLKFGLRHRATWKEIGYGFVWTLALGYFVGVLTDEPPWTLTFWETRGPWLFLAVIGALCLLGVVYLGSEAGLYLRERAVARHNTLREWHRRWFRRPVAPGADDKLRAVLRSPLLRQFPPPEQAALAALLEPHRAGPWRILHDFGAPVSHVSLILSGKVGVYRQLPSGRRTLVQTLCEDDLVGLHAAADPQSPRFLYRTLTPVVLLRLDWAQAEALIVKRVANNRLSTLVHKLPFLSRLSLCQNWHVQAIQRFAELSTIHSYQADDTMLLEGSFNENFFIVFEGDARIHRQGRPVGKVSVGAFFGEIGLLQNSNATASVIANAGTRVLAIQRREFLRFVAHNYSVALELERVSSERLGRPIFPMREGDFRGT